MVMDTAQFNNHITVILSGVRFDSDDCDYKSMLFIRMQQYFVMGWTMIVMILSMMLWMY